LLIMTLKRRTFFWLGILLFFLALAAWGYYLYNKPHRSAADAAVAFTIDADSLFMQYQQNEQGADRKYLNKVILVSGTLAEIQHTGSSEIWILSAQPGTSQGGSKDSSGGDMAASPGGGINCQLFSPDKAPSPRPRLGDPVTIKGRCTGFLMDVNLADCVPQ
jgi:hypothetical protein